MKTYLRLRIRIFASKNANTMTKKLLSTKMLLLGLLGTVLTLSASAAETFVSFSPQDGFWQLNAPTIFYANTEHSCVRLAADNLMRDFENVTGQKPALREAEPTILIGTVGANRQIDQWVKEGKLSNLKGKTEKYIIKTIGNQLVIAGSEIGRAHV